ncbi:hypothetical protein GN244_ATG04788 [Phytophthora infestans]|uniref:Uncharacterized protein n=1 Tax=Phytophthora infestans TaxID=4787 RepID=A0A833TGP1_PHYIN|nr:hypothetical protein GN244_ATG04788 [Phytophthora infestans]
MKHPEVRIPVVTIVTVLPKLLDHRYASEPRRARRNDRAPEVGVSCLNAENVTIGRGALAHTAVECLRTYLDLTLSTPMTALNPPVCLIRTLPAETTLPFRIMALGMVVSSLGMIRYVSKIDVKMFDDWKTLEAYLRNYGRRTYQVGMPISSCGTV